jgi:hypothetical protein
MDRLQLGGHQKLPGNDARLVGEALAISSLGAGPLPSSVTHRQSSFRLNCCVVSHIGTTSGFTGSATGEILSGSPSDNSPRRPPLKRKEIIAREQNGAAGALERCRVLADQILAEVREKQAEGLDTVALAEFLVALGRAASVLSDRTASTVRAAPNPAPPPDEPPAPVGS